MSQAENKKPLVRAVVFTRNRWCYAFFDQNWESDDFQAADWEAFKLRSHAVESSAEWYRAAFEGCLTAYRRLQARHPDKDLVLTSDDPGIGQCPFFYRRRTTDSSER